MKNYPHLYPTPVSKKVSALARTPKTKPTVTSTITTKPSNRTLPYHMLQRDKHPHIRNLTRSIESVDVRSEAEEELIRNTGSQEDEQLFSQSYSKIGRIRQSHPQKNIDSELNEVLSLIREEKGMINERMRALKRSNDQYKQLCENYMKGKLQCGVNTEELEQGRVDASVECEIVQIKIEQQQTENSEKIEEGVAVNQNYVKLCKMLQDMSINPKDILPYQKQIPGEILIADYNELSERQIIQIQKFFIKKLIEKLPK